MNIEKMNIERLR